jgi:23S rRNA pseudouridine1911/1915/1917 synthase
MTKAKVQILEIPPNYAGRRLDQALAGLFPDVTRSQLQRWIAEGFVLLNERVPRKRDRVAGGERIELRAPEIRETPDVGEPIAIDIVHEDDSLVVINKPAGLVVHPGAGNARGTLLNALLHYRPESARLPRAGVVHRLDKDTSGLIVVAKTEQARQALIRDLQARTVTREYIAIVNGVMIAGGSIDAPIGRHRSDRTRMAVTSGGRAARSHCRVLKKYRAHTLVQIRLESGRTHQIRVHMAHLKFPIVGDPVYGGRVRVPARAEPELVSLLRSFKRQALHATKLSLVHPVSGASLCWTVSVPEDMGRLMEVLAEDASEAPDRRKR